MMMPQLVWKGTTSIGCGVVTTCSNTWRTIVVCNYSPAGNVMDFNGGYSFYIQNVKPPGNG
jgi:hypothetical protein